MSPGMSKAEFEPKNKGMADSPKKEGRVGGKAPASRLLQGWGKTGEITLEDRKDSENCLSGSQLSVATGSPRQTMLLGIRG